MKELRNWCVEDGCEVLWTDESKFESCGSSRKCYVPWRNTECREFTDCVEESEKQ